MKRAVMVGALVIAGAALWWWIQGRTPGPSVSDGPRSLVVMDAEDSAEIVIPVYAPLDQSRVSIRDLPKTEFRWGGVPGARRYRLIVNNEVGAKIWQQTVFDTVAVLPDKITGAVLPGGQLKWIVGVEGMSASSDIYRVELTR